MLRNTITSCLYEQLGEYGDHIPILLLFLPLLLESSWIHLIFTCKVLVSESVQVSWRTCIPPDYWHPKSALNLIQSEGIISQITTSTLVNEFLSSSAEEICIVFYEPSANIDIAEKSCIGGRRAEILNFQLPSRNIQAHCDLVLMTLRTPSWLWAVNCCLMYSKTAVKLFSGFLFDLVPIKHAKIHITGSGLVLLMRSTLHMQPAKTVVKIDMQDCNTLLTQHGYLWLQVVEN